MSQLSILELQRELERRVQQLREKRDELLKKASEIERELERLGVITEGGRARGGPGRRGRHPANGSPPKTGRRIKQTPLVEVLASILDDRSMTTREAADAALAAGYETRSRNFVNSVNVALHRDERFTKKEGKWAMSG